MTNCGKLCGKKLSTYELREKCDIDSKAIRRLRANENVETETLNKLCEYLDYPLEEIACFVPGTRE